MWDANQGLNQLASAADRTAAAGEDQGLGPPRAPLVPPAGSTLPSLTAANAPCSRVSPDADAFREPSPSSAPTSSGRGVGGGVTKKGRKSAASNDTYAQRHQAAEARRRNRINERIEALRKLVPNDPRANTATFLEDVIKYILSLQDSNEKLEAVFQAFSQQQQQHPSQQAHSLQAQQPQQSQQQQQQQQPEPQHSNNSNQSRQNSDSLPQLMPPNHVNGLHLPASSSISTCLPPPLQLPACVPLETQLQGGLPLQALMFLQQQHHQQSQAQQLQQLQLQLQGVSHQHAHQALLQQQQHQQQRQQQQMAGAVSAELLNSSSTPILTHSGNLPHGFPAPPLGHSLLPLPVPQLQHQPAQLLQLPMPQLAASPAPTLLASQLQLAGTLPSLLPPPTMLPHSTTLPQQLTGLGVGAAGPIIGGSSALATSSQLLGSQQGGPSTVSTMAPSASPITPAPALGGEQQGVLSAPTDLTAAAQ
eukprot:CAMPEP_0202358128 /NCGR_PEP_ID=MMETSP1126-20121109/11889_1 /ASSEMBLY_ACC=CAM_ASM_000457 /TAXON_ID=3047 /ORGANISM="Dunaliella tertiolecta, Strain CCMP1320" /LENGTH=475 /DNA_ID=CAMNT_0048951167 /DNA_START=106 /DNA_END=1533 /DNA_ORIENTATION=-